MKRRYQRELYVDRVAKIKELMPGCCIGVDVIVGFPGETQEHFLETYEFLNQLDISYLHVFTYSERPGTPAAAMPGAVPVPVRKQRNKVLRDLAAAKNAAFRERMLGREVSAVTMEPAGLALTENFVHAQMEMPYTPNRVVRLRPVALTNGGVTARIVSVAPAVTGPLAGTWQGR